MLVYFVINYYDIPKQAPTLIMTDFFAPTKKFTVSYYAPLTDCQSKLMLMSTFMR